MVATQPIDARRYDLDWLRIIAFGLLIFYHVGMFYVSWDWHVKSAHASPAIEPLMRLVNPWRLALLFFISGVAVRFAIDKAESLGGFALSRIARLGLPLLFGVFVWVMPQAYFEVLRRGEFSGSMVDFYPQYLSADQAFSIITPTWNHLWYLAYVLVYVLLAIALIRPLRTVANSAFWSALQKRPLVVVFVLILPFVAIETWLTPRFPTTHDLVNDWANHAHRFLIFVIGFLVAKHAEFWRTVDRSWIFALPLAVLCWLLLAFGGAWVSAAGDALPLISTRSIFSYFAILYAWSCILALLGFGQRFLNRPSHRLRYLTGAIFCYYVLHQTITVTAGHVLNGMALGVAAEAALMVGITLAGCLAGYELLRRVPGLRVLFGIHAVSGFRKPAESRKT